MQNHYNYAFDGITNTYNFPTKNGILYRVAFVEDHTLSEISGKEILNVFQFVIEKIGDEKEGFDAKISETIKHIIGKFFEQSQYSIIYVCSNDENKAEQRFKVFSRWYEHSGFKNTIIKIDNVIEIVSTNENMKIFTSLLFHVENKNTKAILEIYNAIGDVLNNK